MGEGAGAGAGAGGLSPGAAFPPVPTTPPSAPARRGSRLEGLAAALPCVPGSPVLAQYLPDPPAVAAVVDPQWARPALLLSAFLVLRVGLQLTYPAVFGACALLLAATAPRAPTGRKPKVK